MEDRDKKQAVKKHIEELNAMMAEVEELVEKLKGKGRGRGKLGCDLM